MATAAAAGDAKAAASDQAQSRFTFLNGENTPQNIAAYAFFLGGVFGIGLGLAAFSQVPAWISPSLAPFGLYLALVAVFHTAEYIVTAVFNGPKLSLESFLIDHSMEYGIAFAAATVEFWLEWYFLGSWKFNFWISALGFVVTTVAQTIRTVAMIHAKSNFSHEIADWKESDHVLVTEGLYAYVRHPSYCGFFYWAVGTQLLLCNPVCCIGFGFAIYKFFVERIEYEEFTLVRFFGQAYIYYRKKVPSGVPFIP